MIDYHFGLGLRIRNNWYYCGERENIASLLKDLEEHQGLVPVPLIIAKRLNSIRGTRRFTKPSQTNGYLIF